VGEDRTSSPNLDFESQEPSRHLEGNLGDGFRRRHDAGVHRPTAQGDRGVAAHRRVALVVGEQDGEVGLGVIGSHGKHAVHVGVAARFVHQHAAEVVVMLGGVTTLVEDGVAFDGRITVGDYADRFATGVHLDGAQSY